MPLIGGFLRHEDRKARELTEAARKNLPRAHYVALWAWVMRYTRHLVRTRFMGPGGKTDTLRKVTGTTIQSITASPTVKQYPGRTIGWSGSRLEHVRKHEQGGTFREQVPAHLRRRTARQRRGFRAKKVRAGFNVLQLQRDPDLASQMKYIRVRAHQRVRTYRARRMFRHAFDETIRLLNRVVGRSMAKLLATGRAPSMAEARSYLPPERG